MFGYTWGRHYGRSSTLFDEFMICMSSVPSRIREGMVLLSGDVLLLFNPLQIDYNSVGAAAISFKENVETGKNHGVYLNGPDGNVKCCLQKKSVEVLREAGAVNESGCVDIDTGALIFSTDIMKSLYSLIETDADYDRNVNERTRLSLYADFLYPLASDSTLEDFYREKPEGEFCPELTAARTRVWEVLRPYRMKLLRLAPAKFIHFGTTREILELMNGGVDEYHYLGWSRKVGSSIRSDVSGYNSVLSSRASILSAACVKAVFEFMGIAYTEEDLYAHVLAMEQIMSTGGGWQDQVGGITPGLKYITSMPGLQQQLQVAHIELSPQTKKELDERFVLIYTGQRRLARNLLRDVVGRYVGNEPDSLFALEEIQKTAALMRFELERGNVDGFAKLLDYHWELSKKIDAGSSNTLIEQIFSSIEELVDGKLVCGAGGGGFLQVILKKGVTRQMVEERLKEVFMDSLVGVADCNLVWE